MSNSKRSITILIGVIGVLLVLLAGTIGYILGNSSIISGDSSSKTSAIADDKKIMKEIEVLKAIYDSKIAEKTNNYKALVEEKEKVQVLVAELEKTKNDAKALVKYKTEYQSLESKMKVLVNEIVVLKNKKTNIIFKQNKPQIVKIESKAKFENTNNYIAIQPKKEVIVSKSEPIKPKSDDFFAKKELSKSGANELVKPIPEAKKTTVVRSEKISKVTVSNVKAAAYNIKSGTRFVETNVSNKADMIKINFTLDEVSNAKAGEKTYYIQIINARNNVIGKRITEYFDNETLTYSFSKTINYDNHSQDCTVDFMYKDFEKGVYFVNVFDRNDLVGISSFTLK
jgi:hypothetical protein